MVGDGGDVFREDEPPVFVDEWIDNDGDSLCALLGSFGNVRGIGVGDA